MISFKEPTINQLGDGQIKGISSVVSWGANRINVYCSYHAV